MLPSGPCCAAPASLLAVLALLLSHGVESEAAAVRSRLFSRPSKARKDTLVNTQHTVTHTLGSTLHHCSRSTKKLLTTGGCT
jgi:hypothetical protein